LKISELVKDLQAKSQVCIAFFGHRLEMRDVLPGVQPDVRPDVRPDDRPDGRRRRPCRQRRRKKSIWSRRSRLAASIQMLRTNV